jgi:Subtilase family
MRAPRIVVAAVLALLLLAPAALAASPLRKLDWTLRQMPSKPRLGLARASAGGTVVVDVYVRGSMRPAVTALRRLGMQVSGVSARRPERMVEGPLPVDRLDDVARLSLTKAVLAVPAPLRNVGSATSQGDAPHHGPQVRALGDTGQGITVGVMSDSINRVGGGVSGSQTSGDLPPDVRVLADGPPATATDEGRAMAEIVYDEAPGIPTFLFATAFGAGAATKAANIGALASNGARIIVDDTGFLSEPMFQDGVVAQAVDQATARGAAYFVSAGNQARQSWEGTFTPVGTPAQNDFDPGPGQDVRQTIASVPANAALTLVLDWAEPWGHASTDFAIDVFNEDTATKIGTINSDNIASGIPMEGFTFPNGSSPTTISIAIRRVAGTGTPAMKWIADGDFVFAPEHATNSDAIGPDAASARSAITVAANRFNTPGTVEPFSSRGPSVTHLFDAAGNPTVDVRPKPDVAGADGVSTSLSGFNPFFGTSAAAPSAAGVAALLLSAKPSLPVDELNAIMREPSNAIDCAAPGFPDADCGSGFILADGKLGRVLDSTPPAVAPVVTPSVPDGPNGWYHGNVSLSWNVADDGSPIGRETGCGPASITVDSVTTFSCAALSAGGTTTAPMTIKRDASPPTTPTFTGIRTGTFNAKRLPGRSRVRCTATDPTSGVDSCRVSGFSRRPGRHTLKAVATNDAGLASTAQLRYRVRAAAARRLRVPRGVSLPALRASGLRFSVSVRVRPTTLVGRLLSKGKVVGRMRKRAGKGTAHLLVRLNSRGGRLRPGVLRLVVTASSTRASTATLHASVRVR